MNIKPIRNDEDLEAALARVDALMNNVAPGTPEGDELEVLTALVEEYENRRHPIALPATEVAI